MNLVITETIQEVYTIFKRPCNLSIHFIYLFTTDIRWGSFNTCGHENSIFRTQTRDISTWLKQGETRVRKRCQ